MALFEPDLVSHVILVCTPYMPQRDQFIDTETIVKHPAGKSFGYQLQLKSGEVEERVKSREEIGQALNALYGGWQQHADGGEYSFSVEEGILFDRFMKAEKSPLLSEEVGCLRSLTYWVRRG